MRERLGFLPGVCTVRYTLTYNEGTLNAACIACMTADIPSHIMREQSLSFHLAESLRYTLTYNEGTNPARVSALYVPIYPHI